MKRGLVVVLAVLVVVAAGMAAAGPAAGTTEATGDNEPPLVEAGLDQHVTAGDRVILDGTGSRDPDGEIAAVEWTIETPNASTTLPGCPDCVRTSFRPRAPGAYAVTLTVTDDDGATRSDTLYVTVEPSGSASDPEQGPNGPSVSLAGPNTVGVGELSTFTARATRGSAPLDRIVWRVDGTVVRTESVGPGSQSVSLDRVFGTNGSHVVSATVVDVAGRSDQVLAAVEVLSESNRSRNVSIQPSVTLDTADGDRTIEPGNGVELIADAVDIDGRIVDYTWYRDGNRIGATGETTSRTPKLNPGQTVTYSVVVTDDDGNKARDSVTIEARRDPPDCEVDVGIYGPDYVDKNESATFEVKASRSIDSVNWRPEDGTEIGDPATEYRRRFEGIEDRYVLLEAEVQMGQCTKYVTKRVNIVTTFTPNESDDSAPQMVSLRHNGTLIPPESESRDANSEVNRQHFVVRFEHRGNESVTLKWKFDDGLVKTTHHEAQDGIVRASITRQFYYETGDVGAERKSKPVSLTVVAIDETGDRKQRSWNGEIDHQPEVISRCDMEEGLVCDLGLTLLTNQTINPGEKVLIQLPERWSVKIRWGDGETFYADRAGGSNKVSHVYDQPGTYTIEAISTKNNGQYAQIKIHVEAETYTVYSYLESVESTKYVTSATRPGMGWKRDARVRPNWIRTDQTKSLLMRNTPDRYFDSRKWRKEGSHVETRYRRKTTLSSTDPDLTEPDSENDWKLVEENVECTNLDGDDPPQFRGGDDCVWVDRWASRSEILVTVVDWRRYRQDGWIWRWKSTEYSYRTVQSLTRPDEYSGDSLETTTYSCANESAPMQDQACGS